NRKRAVSHLAHDRETKLLTLYQVHGAESVIVHEPWEICQGPKADAMITSVPQLALGILTADCAPVLLADSGASVIAVVHAGWKGALAGVTDSVITAMEQLGAKRDRITAAIGPCISQPNYEVGPEFAAQFRGEASSNTRFFIPS